MYYVILITSDGMDHTLPDVFGSKELAEKVGIEYLREKVCDRVRIVKRAYRKDVIVSQFKRKGV